MCLQLSARFRAYTGGDGSVGTGVSTHYTWLATMSGRNAKDFWLTLTHLCSLLARPLSSVLMSDLTHILSAIDDGDPYAAEQLLPLVYDELRKLATLKPAQEKPGQTWPMPVRHADTGAG